MADHFLGIQKEKEIRVDPGFAKQTVREEARADKVLKINTVHKETHVERCEPREAEVVETHSRETNFSNLVR